MVEVEKKFLLNEKETEKLVDGAEFLKEVRLEDAYYDLPGFPLIKHDRYLRSRNGKFELKLLAGDRGEFNVNVYEEVEDETEIQSKLSLGDGNMMASLEKAGYFVVAHIKSVRRKYKKGEFSIDLDTTDFGYNLAEIELMVPSGEGVNEATEKILKFATETGVKVAPGIGVRGKLLEFLYRDKPDVYKEIVEFWRSAGSTKL